MKKATIYVSDFYKNNRIFDLNDRISNRDNCLYHFKVLKDALLKSGYDLGTQDINTLQETEIVIYNDMPDVIDINTDKVNLLILGESEIIRPDNWNKENHKYFDKVFTWNDEWVDGKKYIKYYWPNKIPENIEFKIAEKTKLCTLIAGNKTNNDSRELYSERVRAIEWFEKYAPADFDFYGIGWNEKTFNGKTTHYFNRFKFLKRLFAKKYNLYKGKVESKNEVLKKYKFAICYENARDIPGYITEKIFDCFFAGCVPIYCGAPNILNFIPQNTFIRKDDFNSYEELYKYIKIMTDEEYKLYLDNIKGYLESDKFKLFSAENFANIITDQISE